jgi:hypothetical protein
VKGLSSWLYWVTSGWVAVLAVVIFAVFSATVLPAQSASEPADQDVPAPDLSIYYTADELYRMAESYGQAGRQEYVRARFTFDLVWPVVYTLFLTALISWIGGRVLPEESRWRLVNLLPLTGMAFDYLENIATSLVMLRYPAETPVVPFLAGVFTSLKWLFIGAAFIVLVVLLILGLLERLRR